MEDSTSGKSVSPKPINGYTRVLSGGDASRCGSSVTGTSMPALDRSGQHTV